MKSKKVLGLIFGFAAVCITSLIVSLAVMASELPTVDKLFDGDGVSFETGVTDGKTNDKGLLLTASEAGASAEFKLDLSEALHINLKTLGGSAPKFHIELTDVFGQTFSIYSAYKSAYDNLYVELEGNRGGIYQFSDKWDMKTGYTAAYNTKLETYTQFFRTYSKENRNDLDNPVTADADCLHLEFNPQTMQVGIRRFAADKYMLIWDLSKESNDGHNIGASLDYFGDYTFKIVFDEVEGNSGKILIYSINGYDLSNDRLEADDKLASVAVPLISKAQIGKAYTFPAAVVKSISGSDGQNAITSVNGQDTASYTPTSGKEFTVTYKCGDITRDIKIPVLGGVSSDLDSAKIPANVGINQRIELPALQFNTNLSYFEAPVCATVSVKDADGANVTLENSSFVATKAGKYTVTYTALDGLFTKEFAVNASSSAVGINYQIFADVYRIGHILTVNNASIIHNGTELESTTMVKFPSGKLAQSGNVILSESGDYTVIHTYDFGGEKTFEQKIHVEEAAEDLFEGDTKVNVTYGPVPANNDFSGVKISFDGNRVVEYQKIIDLSDNRFDTDSNTGDLLVELVAQPMSIGTADLEKIELFFTDVNDPSNVMSISLAYFLASRTVTKIHAKGTGQVYSARRVNGEITTVMDAGFNARHSFIQTVRHDGSSINGEFENYTLKLYYDYEENALYGTPEWNKDSYLILDFDDPSMFPSNPWAGFSDGKVKMSVQVSGVASVADIFVLNVDGTYLNSEYFTDIQAPVIQSSISTSSPLAMVNTPYPLIPFDSIDFQSGISEMWWEVIDKYGNKQTITNNTFTPQNIGKYTVIQYAKDYFGNIASNSVAVNSIPYVAGVVLNVNGEIPENVIYGQYVELPEYTVDSGAGLTTVTVSVTKDGRDIPVDELKFFVDEEGVYEVTYKAVDYIGNTNYKSFFVNATLGGKPSIDMSKISLPVAFIHGESYIFEDYRASFYAGAGAHEELISAKITVTDAAGTRTLDTRTYIPVVTSGSSTVNEIIVSFIFEKDGLEPLVIEKTVSAVNPIAEAGYMSDYFLTENGTAKSYANGVVFSALANGNMTVKYIRPLNTRDMSIKFVTVGFVTEQLTAEEIEELKSELVGAGKAYATVEELDAALEEKVKDVNGNETDEYVGVEYNGVKYYKIRRFYLRDSLVDFRNFGSFAITLQDSLNPAERVTVTYKRNGNSFISNICGKTANTGTNMNNEFFLRYDPTTMMISDASNNKLGALTMTDAGKAFNGFSSGSVYVTITVQDITGNCSMLFKQMNNHAFNDNATDNITPVLWLNGTVDGRYQIGKVALIPSADAYDVLNKITAPTVTITAPDGTVLLDNAPADIEYKLTLGQYGTYMVVYAAKDGTGNIITTTKSLLVSDERAPALKFSSGIAKTAKVGDTIDLPTYTVIDNGASKVVVEVTLRKPNGQFDIVTGTSVKFDRAGRYTINYFAVDEDNNTTVYFYTVVVTE